jgi:hypothetical protein
LKLKEEIKTMPEKKREEEFELVESDMFNSDERKIRESIESFRKVLTNEISVKFTNKVKMLKEEVNHLKNFSNQNLQEITSQFKKVFA